MKQIVMRSGRTACTREFTDLRRQRQKAKPGPILDRRPRDRATQLCACALLYFEESGVYDSNK